MAQRVLVTRPEPGATRTARRLEALGFEPVLLPLSETRPLPLAGESVLINAKAVVVTSANALRHAPSGLIERLSHLPCHAVGARTAESARKANFLSVNEGPGDADTLIDMITIELGKATLAYLCGRVRMPDLERRLGVNGMRVVPIETYDTIALVPDASMVSQRLGWQPIDAVLLYSARSAAAFGTLMEMYADADLLMQETTCFCLSSHIASALVDGMKVEVAPDPNEDALLALLGDPN